jgi:hypothetical protein
VAGAGPGLTGCSPIEEYAYEPNMAPGHLLNSDDAGICNRLAANRRQGGWHVGVGCSPQASDPDLGPRAVGVAGGTQRRVVPAQ